MIRLDELLPIYPHSAMSSATQLPEGLYFDLVLAEEVEAVHQLEIQGKLPLILSYVLYVTVALRFFSRRSGYHR